MKINIKYVVLCSVSAASLAQSSSENYRLEDVVITGSSIEQTMEDSPASISVMGKEELEKRPIHNIADGLKYVEGVTLTADNNQGISLRGLGASYTLILIDGKRVSSKYLSVRHNADTDLGWVSPNDIERIEVVRGPMASLYGADAIGGVVNIITKKTSNNWKSYAEVSQTESEEKEQGSSQQINIGTSGPIIKDKLGLKFSARRTQRERSTFEDGDARAFPGQEKQIFNTELNYKVDQRNTVKLQYQYTEDNQETLGRNYEVTDVENIRQYYGVEHELITDDANWSTRIFGESYDYQNGDSDSELGTIIADTKYVTPISTNHLIVAGVEFQQYDLDFESQSAGDTETSDENTENNQVAIYIEDTYQLADNATLTYGARNTKNSKFSSSVTPRAYLNYKLNDEVTIKTGVGTGFKAPTLLQLTEDFKLPSCRGTCTVVGNPDLEPEESISYEVGTYFKRNHFNFNITAFYNKLDNMINTYFITEGSERFRYYRNINKVSSYGIETGTSFKLTQNLDLRVNYSFNYTRDEETNDRILGQAHASGNVLLDWYINDQHSMYTAANYTGKIENEDNGVIETTDPFLTVDLGYTYKFKYDAKQLTTLTTGIENLVDHTLSNDYGYGIMGRRYFVKLGHNF